MRSGRGKCPQCKEMIVVDLDAQEIRCPFCNALLKKSKKTVEEVRAENEAREAAAAAREQAAAEEAAAAVQAEATQEEVAAPVDQPVAEEIPEEVPTQEEVAAEDIPATNEPAQEVSAEEPVDEIGISDEDLAAMDEAPVTEEASEDAEATQADEIGISDEELAAMDEAPASEEAEEPQVFGSIAVEEEAPAPEEEEDTPDEETEVEDEIGSGSVEIADDTLPADDANVVDETPVEEEETPVAEDAIPAEDAIAEDVANEVAEDVVTDDIPEAIPAEQVEDAAEQEIPETVAEAISEEIPAVVVADEAPAEAAAEQSEDDMMANLPAEEDDTILGDDLAQAPAEDDLVSEDMPMDDDLAAPEEQVAEAEAIAPEEGLAEEGIEDAEEAEEQEEYVPSEEDMAFAASLSETGKATPAPVAAQPVGFQKQQNDGGQNPSGKGDKKMEGNSMFKKPIAIIMLLLSIAAGVFYFLYYHVAALAVFSEELPAKIADSLPEIGSDGRYIIMIFWGTLAVISILAMTSRKMCPAAVFAFIAIAIELCLYLLPIYLADNADFMKYYVDYAEYAEYAMYGMLFLSLIFVGIAVDSAAYRGSRGMSVLPALYFIVALAVYGVFIVFDRYLSEIKFIADIVNNYDKYIIMGVWGVALLLTLVGVHNGRHSRSANGWIFFMGLLLMLVSFLAQKGLDIFDKQFMPSSILDYPYFNPVIALVGFAGYTAADLRN